MIIEEDFSDIVSYAIAMSAPYSDRAHSFDFCYLYFRRPKDEILGNIEESCYALWSFLSSWGMVRGSTELLQKTPACLQEVVKYIAENDLSKIDIEDYSDKEVQSKIVSAYGDIRNILKESAGINNPTITLVTKIMLGVYSCIPAFDNNFCSYYKEKFHHGCTCINNKVLTNLYSLRGNISLEPCYLMEFDGTKSTMEYNKVKMLDLYGFNKGRELMAKITDVLRFEQGNLFERAGEFNIDGIFAPVYSGRDILVDTYKQQCEIVPHLIEYRYSRDLSKKECWDLYFAELDALVKLGAKQLATYSVCVQNESGNMTGKEKVGYINSVLKEWCVKNRTKFDSFFFSIFVNSMISFLPRLL